MLEIRGKRILPTYYIDGRKRIGAGVELAGELADRAKKFGDFTVNCESKNKELKELSVDILKFWNKNK